MVAGGNGVVCYNGPDSTMGTTTTFPWRPQYNICTAALERGANMAALGAVLGTRGNPNYLIHVL